jgi:steroid delta-isomerase-like uncharacterized protein
MTTQDNATLTRMAYDLYNDHQSDSAWLDKSLAAIAEDCEVFLVPLGMTLRGRDGYQQFLLGWAEAFPDSSVEITNLLATEDHAVIEFIGRGTHTGTLHGPAGDIPATGRKVEFRLCDVRRINNGKFVSLHQYYDALGFMQQLGLIPTMG